MGQMEGEKHGRTESDASNASVGKADKAGGGSKVTVSNSTGMALVRPTGTRHLLRDFISTFQPTEWNDRIVTGQTTVPNNCSRELASFSRICRM